MSAATAQIVRGKAVCQVIVDHDSLRARIPAVVRKDGNAAGKRHPAHPDAPTACSPVSNDNLRRAGTPAGIRENSVHPRKGPSSARLLVVSTIAALVQAGHCAADEVPVVGRMVVTASRFPAALEQPVGMTIITGEDIANSTATSLGEVLSRLGGVHVRQNLSGTPDQPLDLRGFGASGDQNTLVLINGQRISENELVSARISAVPLNSIERIEILRGSGSVLYGGGGTGGTINIVTRGALGHKPGGSVFGSAGSYGASELRAAANGGNDNLGFAVFANRTDSDNYRQNNHATVDNVGGEVALGEGTSRASLRVSGNRQRVRLPGPRSERQFHDDPRGTSTPNDLGRLDGWDATLNAKHRIGSVDLAADIGYREKSSDYFNGFDSGTFTSEVDAHATTFAPRIKWNGALGGMQNILIAGFDWSDWQYKNRSVFAGDGFSAPTNERATQRNRAAYLQNNLQLAPATRLTLGARHERVQLKAAESETPIPERSRTYSLNAWEAGLRHNFSAALAAYVRVGRSFRVAIVDEVRCAFPPCQALLEPQTSNDRELGLEYRTAELAAQLALFDISLNREIHFNRLSGFFGQNENLPKTRRRGVEMETSFSASRTIDLSARYAYTQAEFRDGNFSGVEIVGNEVPAVPRHRASASVNWLALPSTRAVLSLTYIGAQRYDNDQANRFSRMPSYTVTDFKLTHTVGAVTLGAGINNLFDRKYYSYALVDDPLAPTSFNAYPEARRNGYVSVGYCW